MLSIKIAYFIQLLLMHFNSIKGLCPHAHKFFEMLSRCDDIQSNYNEYLSAMSYNTYETDCHRFVQQPPPISDTIIDHALKTSIDRAMRYASLDMEASTIEPSRKVLRDSDYINYYFESATEYVQATTCSSKNTTTVYLSTLQLEEFKNFMIENITEITCDQDHVKYPNCSNKSSYSNVDGTCNNLERPLDGYAGDCMRRLLPPDYKDGISELRTSIDGSPLPNARLVSTKLLGHDDNRPLSTRYTQFHAFFGEFVIEFVIGDNGLTVSNDDGNRIDIRSCDHESQARTKYPQFKAFYILPDDIIRQTYPNQTCMPFDRSVPCARCRLGPRMLSNSITAAQDLNIVYGVSTSMLNARRTMSGGSLQSQIINGHEIYAVERFNATGRYRCFEGKCEISPLDERNAQLPTGQALALLFHRNHNRHARKLATIKPDWSDEKLFQEARKWNIAEYQHCVYNEYIRTLIGEKMANNFRILPKKSGQFSNYEPDVQLKTIVEFQTTAGRQGHVALSEDILIIEPKSGNKSKINFRQSELHESLFYDGLIDGMFLAQLSNPAFETTPSVPFKTFLYDVPGKTFGLDLGALDVQRQRDHGVPGYVHYLRYCHNHEVRQWTDLSYFIDSKNIEKLKIYYRYVEDVELYVGGHYERKLGDVLVGPTFASLIGLQFHNAKYGDRFFYEHGDQISSFSIDQLNEIKAKATLASVLCKNTVLDRVLADPLRLKSNTNQFVSCSAFDYIDYKL